MSTDAPEQLARLSLVGRARFGASWSAAEAFQAPGRIELIGNHLDYNGGPVLAAAIDRGITAGVSHNARPGIIRVVFADLDETKVHVLSAPWADDWQSAATRPQAVDYLRGVVTALTRRGLAVRDGVDLVVTGNLPHGIGISSSAALCVVLTLALVVERPHAEELVLIAQEAEHRVGSPCGTMDQAASVAGGLIRYDGASGAVAPVESHLGDHSLIVVNSGVVRTLAASAYPERVREANRALRLLQDAWRPQLTALAAIEIDSLQDVLEILADRDEPTLVKRVRHIVTETDRVNRAIAAIADPDWRLVGRLMHESGQSSAQDYEISHPAVEQIVSICMNQPGVLGARMMGGGQGGSALVLVASGAVTALVERLQVEYFGKLRDRPPLLRTVTCRFAAGAGIVPLHYA